MADQPATTTDLKKMTAAITVALDDLTATVTNAFHTNNHNRRRRDRRSNQVHVPAYVNYNQIMESFLLQVRWPSELKKLHQKLLQRVEVLPEILPEKEEMLPKIAEEEVIPIITE